MPTLIQLERENGEITINADKIVAIETIPIACKYKTVVLLADYTDGFITVKEKPEEIDRKISSQICWIHRNLK